MTANGFDVIAHHGTCPRFVLAGPQTRELFADQLRWRFCEPGPRYIEHHPERLPRCTAR